MRVKIIDAIFALRYETELQKIYGCSEVNTSIYINNKYPTIISLWSRGYFFIMRKLRVGTEVLRMVAGNKDMIDALAFAILIKQERINSLITNPTQRRLKELFAIGSDKLRKVLKDGLQYGFLRYDGDSLIACKLHENKFFSAILKREWFIEAKKNNKKNRLTLTDVRAIIETMIVVNQVKMQNDCKDTHKRATSPSCVAELRSAKRRESRMLQKDFCDKFTGLSNIRIQQLIARKHGKAVKTVKSAIKKGLLSKKTRELTLNIEADDFCSLTKKVFEELYSNVVFSLRYKFAYLRFSNVYSYTGRNINLSHHGN